MILADREMVESSSDDILQDAQNVDVAFLVVGDPFGYLCPFPFSILSISCAYADEDIIEQQHTPI